VGNKASYGGGIYCWWSYPTLINTILWDNQAPIGKEIYLGTSADPSILSISYSDVDGGQLSAYIDSNCTLNWNDGMIDADPLFVTGPFGDYYLSQVAAGQSGGDENLFPLQAVNSPCVDAGKPELLLATTNTLIGTTTTRTDWVPDSGIIDMGYHYPLMDIQIPPGHQLEEVP